MEKEMYGLAVCGPDTTPADRPRLSRPPEGCDCTEESVCHGFEGCGEGSFGLCDYPLGMVYAPCQQFRALYDPATALCRGTLFTELDLPFGRSACSFTATAAQEGTCQVCPIRKS